MFSIISGAVLVVVSSAVYCYLLPRNGREHPLVKDPNVGSMATLTIMAGFIFGLTMLLEGFFG